MLNKHVYHIFIGFITSLMLNNQAFSSPIIDPEDPLGFYALLTITKPEVIEAGDEQDIKELLQKKFREVAKKTHTDRTSGDEEKFKKLTNARDFLLDQSKRNLYNTGDYEHEGIRICLLAPLQSAMNNYNENRLFELYRKKQIKDCIGPLLDINKKIPNVYDPEKTQDQQNRINFLRKTINAVDKDTGNTLLIEILQDSLKNAVESSGQIDNNSDFKIASELLKNAKELHETLKKNNLKPLHIDVSHKNKKGKNAKTLVYDLMEKIRKKDKKLPGNQAVYFYSIIKMLDDATETENEVWKNKILPDWLKSTIAYGLVSAGLYAIYRLRKNQYKKQKKL